VENFRGIQVHWDLRALEAYKASLGSEERKGALETKVNMGNKVNLVNQEGR
jgi:hypothetical protein